jgi:GT2 family glycosyltransferase
MQIAALLTCHNRRDTTVACLEALSMHCLPEDTGLTIYVVDDGCTDGTAAAVTQRFPRVRLIAGDGDLYWGGGMRLAWSVAAAEASYDAYLWLNDDTTLVPTAIPTLVASWQRAASIGRPGIIVGSTCDPDNARLTYGGYSGRVTLVEPSWQMQLCDTMNGNIVLVPRAVFQVVGNLCSEFRHNGADIDYGLRAQKAGFKIWVAPGFLGFCRQNPPSSWTDPSVPFCSRWRSLQGPKGLPLRERYTFCRRHHRLGWPVDLLKLYLRVSLPGPWHWLKRVTGKI